MNATFAKGLALTALALAAQSSFAARLPGTPVYVASTWSDQKVYLLAANMAPTSSFSVATAMPNGVAASASRVFAGFFTTQSIVSYDFTGVQQFSFTDSRLGSLQGLAYGAGSVIAASGSNTYFFDAMTGAYQREFANSGSTVEGLTYDGKLLWEIGNTLVARDFGTGAQVRSISNAASGCNFGGTGIASAGAGALMLACTDGSWFKVDDMTGGVISSGNNGLNMFGLDSITAAVPEPQTYALMGLGLALVAAARRRTSTAKA